MTPSPSCPTPAHPARPQPTLSHPLRAAMHQIPVPPHPPEHPRSAERRRGHRGSRSRRGRGAPGGAQGSAGAERGSPQRCFPMACGEPKLPCPSFPAWSGGRRGFFQCRGDIGSIERESARQVLFPAFLVPVRIPT